MAMFMEIKTMNPRLTKKEVAKELEYSTCCIQRYDLIEVCFHLIEFHLKVIKENKKFRVVNMASRYPK